MKPVPEPGSPERPSRIGKPDSTEDQLKRLPQGLYSAHRYDTDNEHKLHVWDADGHSYDLVVPKRPS